MGYFLVGHCNIPCLIFLSVIHARRFCPIRLTLSFVKIGPPFPSPLTNQTYHCMYKLKQRNVQHTSWHAMVIGTRRGVITVLHITTVMRHIQCITMMRSLFLLSLYFLKLSFHIEDTPQNVALAQCEFFKCQCTPIIHGGYGIFM